LDVKIVADWVSDTENLVLSMLESVGVHRDVVQTQVLSDPWKCVSKELVAFVAIECEAEFDEDHVRVLLSSYPSPRGGIGAKKRSV
jgi:hypothetical protein